MKRRKKGYFLKGLFIYPPLVHPGQPYLSLPLLVGQLRSKNVDVSSMDLNVKFYNKILTKESIEKAVKRIKLSNNPKILSFLFKNKKRIKLLINNIEDAVNVYKTQSFYNPDKFFKAMKILSFAFEVYSYQFFPTEISFSDLKTPQYDRNYKSIEKFTKDRETNPFIEYFEENIKKREFSKYDFICISVPNAMQIPVVFTLTRVLKQNTEAKIIIGGNVINRLSKVFKKYPEIFDDYIDGVLLGEGEYSIIELSEYIQGKRKIENVSGLIYKIGNEVKENPRMLLNDLSKIAVPDYTGFDFSEYYAPDIVFPLQFGKGCEWGKCTYCGIFHGKPDYYNKSAKQIVNEIKALYKRYGAVKFEFTDECIRPDLFEEIADEILKLEFKIHYFAMARTDIRFTSELLAKLYKSGLRMISWGIESDSPRILKAMNKGINRNKRIDVIRKSKEVGLWNNTYVLFGFPSETKEEAQMTIDLICNNRDIIHSYNATVYWADSKAFIQSHSEIFGLKLDEKQEEFSVYLNYTDSTMTREEKNKIHESFVNQYIEKNGFTVNQIIFPDENLFLYILEKGRDKVLEWKYRDTK